MNGDNNLKIEIYELERELELLNRVYLDWHEKKRIALEGIRDTYKAMCQARSRRNFLVKLCQKELKKAESEELRMRRVDQEKKILDRMKFCVKKRAEGMSYAKIGELLGVTGSRVRQIVFKAKRMGISLP